MESLKLSFDAIAPIFLLMLLGYVLKYLKVCDKKGFDLINKLVFKAFLPTLLFYNIYKTETANVIDPKLVAFTVIGILFVFITGYFAVFGLTKENPKRGVMLQGFFRTNFAILGIPLVSYICGEQAKGLASLMVAIVVPMFNILAVIALERFRDGSEKPNLLKLLKGMAKNPLIIGCAIGLLFLALDIKLPYVIEKAVSDVGSISTPLAIIALGAGFEFSGIGGQLKEISVVIIGRLIVIPLIVLSAAIFCGFSGEALACLLITFGGPIAVSSFPMAQQMDGDEKLAAQIIVISSALCLFTLFLWIFGINYLGLFM